VRANLRGCLRLLSRPSCARFACFVVLAACCCCLLVSMG
jgi:hypothetical protein